MAHLQFKFRANALRTEKGHLLVEAIVAALDTSAAVANQTDSVIDHYVQVPRYNHLQVIKSFRETPNSSLLSTKKRLIT